MQYETELPASALMQLLEAASRGKVSEHSVHAFRFSHATNLQWRHASIAVVAHARTQSTATVTAPADASMSAQTAAAEGEKEANEASSIKLLATPSAPMTHATKQ